VPADAPAAMAAAARAGLNVIDPMESGDTSFDSLRGQYSTLTATQAAALKRKQIFTKKNRPKHPPMNISKEKQCEYKLKKKNERWEKQEVYSQQYKLANHRPEEGR
jgi:hypothetical protein